MRLDGYDRAHLAIGIVMVVAMVSINWPPQPPWWAASVAVLACMTMFAIAKVTDP